MTIIVGLEYGGRLYMGGDSAASSDGLIDKIDRPKIIQKKNITIGYCASFRVGQIVEYNFDFSKMKKNEKWLYSSFVEQLRNTFEKHGVKSNGDGDKISGFAQLVIGFNKRIYILQEDFSILRSLRGYACIGGGADFAYGSLYSTDGTGLTPQERIGIALDAAAEFAPSVAPPFHVVEL